MTVDPRGATFIGYGHSYIQGAITAGYIHPVVQYYSGVELNRAIGGSTWGDTAQRSIGTTETWTVGTRAIVIADSTATHWLFGGNKTSDFRYAENGLRSFLAYLTAAAKVEDTAAAFTYSAGWSASTTSDSSSARNVHTTTTPGAYVDITCTGDAVTFLTFGWLDGQDDHHNASFTITQGSTTLHTYTSQSEAGNYGQYSNATNRVVELTGLGPGAHTIRVTHTGTDGHDLYVDAILTPSTHPTSDIFVTLPVYMAALGYTFSDPPLYPDTPTGSNNAMVDQYRTFIRGIAQQYPVHVVDPLPGWNPVTMIGADGIHPNQTGTNHLAAAVVAAIGLADLPLHLRVPVPCGSGCR